MAWSYPTNFTSLQTGEITNASSVSGMFKYAEYVTQGFFAHGVLITIWAIVFFATFANNALRGVVTASFITMIFAIYLAAAGVAKPGLAITIILVFVVSAVMLLFDRKNNPY